MDDAGQPREPSHSQLEWLIAQADLGAGDPHANPTAPKVGKAKRMRGVLHWSLLDDPSRGEALLGSLIDTLRGVGGFIEGADNYVGKDAIDAAGAAFRAEGWVLASDGQLQPVVLEGLAGAALTEALSKYVDRARRGVVDAALVVGTGKDLVEATAKHVLDEKGWTYGSNVNFPTLLGQAFTALGLTTSATSPQPGETAQQAMDRALYDLGCSVNRLRNKEGTGHGRPFLASLTDEEARAAVEAMGLIADRLLRALEP